MPIPRWEKQILKISHMLALRNCGVNTKRKIANASSHVRTRRWKDVDQTHLNVKIKSNHIVSHLFKTCKKNIVAGFLEELD